MKDYLTISISKKVQKPEVMWNFKINFIWYILLIWKVIISKSSKDFDENSNLADNSSLTLFNILKTYDVRLRPNFGAQPLYIGMDLIISNVDEFSEVNMDYTITIFLNQYWKDERLAFSSQNIMLPLTGDFAEKIWVPDTFFANDKNSFLHDVTEKNKMIRLYGDGSIAYGMRFTTTLICPMNLVSYPLDSQNCTVEIESYGYTTRDLYFYWKRVSGLEEISLHQYQIIEYNMIDRLVQLETGTYQRLSLSILFKRNIGSFVFQMYLPSVLIVMISWISFWISFDAPAARVALGITTILTLLISHNNVRSQLPKISYVKAIDIYLVTCFLFVFAALVEYAAVNYIYWETKAKAARKKTQKKEKWWKTAFRIVKKLKRRKEAKVRKSCKQNVASSGLSKSPSTTIAEPIERKAIPVITTCSIEINGDEITSAPTITQTSPAQKIERLLTVGPQKLSRSSSFSGAIGGREDMPFKPMQFPSFRQKSPSFLVINAKRKRLFGTLKAKAKKIRKKLPSLHADVNTIDNCARLLFPLSFILFNAIYWPYYILTSER